MLNIKDAIQCQIEPHFSKIESGTFMLRLLTLWNGFQCFESLLYYHTLQ